MSEAESVDESIIQTGATERADRAADVTEVNWGDVWAIAKAAPGEPLSPTQASLCVQVSDQCPPETDEPAREYLGRAVEQGALDVERALAATISDDTAPMPIVRGYRVVGGG